MNAGIEKAREAAQAVGGVVAVPELDGKKCDFNDLHRQRGAGAVRAAIEGALPATAAAGALTTENGTANHPRIVALEIDELLVRD